MSCHLLPPPALSNNSSDFYLPPPQQPYPVYIFCHIFPIFGSSFWPFQFSFSFFFLSSSFPCLPFTALVLRGHKQETPKNGKNKIWCTCWLPWQIWVAFDICVFSTVFVSVFMNSSQSTRCVFSVYGQRGSVSAEIPIQKNNNSKRQNQSRRPNTYALTVESKK